MGSKQTRVIQARANSVYISLTMLKSDATD
jgi:hypothetical protein